MGVRPSVAGGTRLEPEEPPWRCASCEAEVADRGAERAVRGRPPVATLTNPHGVVFEVLTVERARNVVAVGPPTAEHSWFPGYAWSTAYCAGCGAHLGWAFDAVDGGEPGAFHGLVRTRIR
jgi:cereblon